MEERLLKSIFRFIDTDVEAAPVARGAPLKIAVGDRILTVDHHELENGRSHFVIDGHVYDVVVAKDASTLFISLDGEVYPIEAIDPVDAAGSGGRINESVRAPMPSIVVSTPVTSGEAVTEGQTLMVIESMKLQTSIVADRGAVIAEVCYAESDTFDKGAELLRYEVDEDNAES